MSDDFDAAFAAASAEVEAGGGAGNGELIPQAHIHTGDDGPDVSEETETVDDAEVDDLEPDDDESEDNPDDGEPETVFDWASQADKLVEVKRNGETVVVPLGEAIADGMRQADYTRKMQEIASVRKQAEWALEMQTALKGDPFSTIQALAGMFGVPLGVSEDEQYDDIDPELKPIMSELQATKAQLAQMQEIQFRMEQERQFQSIVESVKAEVQAISVEFPDFDADQVLPFAAERNIPIRDAYLLQHAEKSLRSKTSSASTAKKAAEIQKAKQDAARKVSRGGSNVQTIEADSGDYDDFAALLSRNLKNSR